MTANMDESDAKRDAGVFGFSRGEKSTLLGLALLVTVVAVADHWNDRVQSTVPPLLVNDELRVIVARPDSTTRQLTSETAEVVAVEYDHRTDVNSAGRWELIRLPGIGDVLADRIIASREKDGPFHSLNDLQRVFGIGPKKAAMLGGWVRFKPVAQRANANGAGE